MRLVILLYLSLFISAGLCAYSISKFQTPPFTVKPSSGMYQLNGLGVGSIPEGAQIMTYGDFNNDKYTDIVTLSDDEKTLTIYVYSHDSFEFKKYFSITPEGMINSVMPGDFNYDGRLDLLLNTQGSTADPKIKYYIQQTSNPLFVETPDAGFTLDNDAQPFLLDADGDRRLDLMLIEDGQRVLKTYNTEGKLDTKPFSTYFSTDAECSKVGDPKKVSGYAFTSPHSNTFADFNGDCAADLMITSTDGTNDYIEIWLRQPTFEAQFCLVSLIQIPTASTISLISVGDINNNGRLDLVYAISPTDANKPMTINILYNKFGGDANKPCSLTDSSMTSPFDPTSFFSSANKTGVNQVFPLPSDFPVKTRLFTQGSKVRPARIRLGDINIDGYPDLLFIVDDKSTKDATSGTLVLAMNQGNTITFHTKSDSGVSGDNKPYYTLSDGDDSAKDLSLFKIPAVSASFFDFDELGKLGFWIAIAESSKPTRIISGFNFVNSENFILKTLGLNGKVPSSSERISESLGGMYYGASLECTVTDINGANFLAKVTQLPQSAYTALDLPYMFLGLGRTNNYIENLVMGISKKNSKDDNQVGKWSPIIPNSQLIVNPLVDKPWTLDVYVNPTSEALLITLVTGIILLILGIIIVYLHYKEKQEDKNNSDRMIHIFG